MTFASERELLRICDALGVDVVRPTARIQSLWSGYGELYRVTAHLKDQPDRHLVVKSVRPPSNTNHPRGWSSSLGHARKLRSYFVESSWYRRFSHQFSSVAMMPEAVLLHESDEHFLIVLSDLDAEGFSARLHSLENLDLSPYLGWLANFHSKGLGIRAEGLWDPGTYWHLATRPDELEAIADPRLKSHAVAIDQRLRKARFRTVVHGDAKLANFCINDASGSVAAVDFQYVGTGVGTQDLAYFLSSAVSPESCARHHDRYLAMYFDALSLAISRDHPQLEASMIIEEWRDLYRWAWADFVRFLAGWAPDHYKLDTYSLTLTRQVLDLIEASDAQF